MATTYAQFEEYYYLMNGTNFNLLWDEAIVTDGGELRWCRKPNTSIPASLQSGLELVGQLPFFLEILHCVCGRRLSHSSNIRSPTEAHQSPKFLRFRVSIFLNFTIS
ncbi:Hypothetical predicted protein [Cloeon dipterum]|uniref:Uncharacterized protein n=1 Tax=Cloeon dipterum TaxID=197152 RepID=A0A8S1CKJ4_9INSE|nr:Hypothetical predicted protein [Cloeon dipterum]